MIWQAPKLWAGATVVCALVAAWLAWPRAGVQPPTPVRWVVFDTSPSVVRARRGLATEYRALLREQSRQAAFAGEALGVVRLDARVEVWAAAQTVPSPTWEGAASLWTSGWESGELGADDGPQTDWGGLARFLLDQFPKGQPGQVVLVSDGAAAQAQAFDFLGRLAQRGVSVHALALPAPTSPDGLLLALEGPEQVPPQIQARWTARMRLTSAAVEPKRSPLESGARLHLRLHQAHSLVKTWEQPIPANGWRLAPSEHGGEGGERTWEQSASIAMPPLDPGVFELEVRLNIPGDRTPENDRQRFAFRVGEPYLVLVAEALPPAQRLAAQGWGRDLSTQRGQPIAWQSLPHPKGGPEDLASDWRAEWDRWLPQAHVLWTRGLAPNDLPDRAVQTFVEAGGAWFFQAESEGLAGWGGLSAPERVDLGAWLPLEVNYGAGPERDVCLLVDGSGSMQGAGWQQVQAACELLLTNLPPKDGFALHLFTRDLMDAALRFPSASADELEAARFVRAKAYRRLMETEVPGGPTDILRSLHSFIETRTGQRPALAVLITDGHESNAYPRNAQELRAMGVAKGVELRIVATGERPDRVFLERLLLPGETIARAQDWEDLKAVLQQEVFGDVLRQDPGMLALARIPKAGAWFAPPELAQGSPVQRYVRTKERAGALGLWRSNVGDPLLAVRAQGLGMVAALPSLEGAQFLREQPGALVEWLAALAARAQEQRGVGPRLVQERGTIQLHDLPSLPSGEPAADAWELWVQPRPGSGAWQPLRLDPLPLSFGLDPRTHRRVESVAFEVAAAELRPAGSDALNGRDLIRLLWPAACAPEFLPAVSRWPDPGGPSWPQAQAQPPSPVRGPHPWAPAFLGIALGLLMVLVLILGARFAS